MLSATVQHGPCDCNHAGDASTSTRAAGTRTVAPAHGPAARSS